MPGFTIYYSPREKLQHRLILDQCGSWSEAVGPRNIITGYSTLKPLDKQRREILDDWSVKNFHKLTKRERPRYRKAYLEWQADLAQKAKQERRAREALRRQNHPTFFERMIDRWRSRK